MEQALQNMTETGLAVLFLATIVGGCLGAQMTKAPIWKGATVAAAAAAGSALVSMGMPAASIYVALIASIVGAVIAGSAMRMSRLQVFTCLLASFVLQYAAIAASALGWLA